jgi:hypothetical protein
MQKLAVLVVCRDGGTHSIGVSKKLRVSPPPFAPPFNERTSVVALQNDGVYVIEISVKPFNSILSFACQPKSASWP